MLPLSLLPNLSPNAAKIYLVLLAHLETTQGLPTAQVPMTTLSELSTLAPRTCAKALRQLHDLNLLRRLPYGFHQSRAYLFLPFQNPTTPPQNPNPNPHPPHPPLHPHPDSSPASSPTQPPQAGHISPTRPPQAGHTNLSASSTPTPAPKNPTPHPQATLLTQPAPAPSLPPDAGYIPDDPAQLRLLAALLPPDQKAELLAAVVELEQALLLNARTESLKRELELRAQNRTPQPAHPPP